MAKKKNASEPSTTVRRSNRIAGKEIAETGEISRRRNNQENQTQQEIQQTPVQRRVMEQDRVSIHTWRSDSQEEADEERTRNERREIARNQQDREIEALETLRQGINEERRAEAEERANLTRQNHELRVENERLQNRRSRSTARSNTVSEEEGRITRTIFHGESSRGEARNQRRRVDSHFVSIPETNEEEIRRELENQRRRRDDEEENPEEGRRILFGREDIRNKQAEIAERNHEEQARFAHNRERARAEREEQEFQEALRQNNHENRIRKIGQNHGLVIDREHRGIPNNGEEHEMSREIVNQISQGQRIHMTADTEEMNRRTATRTREIMEEMARNEIRNLSQEQLLRRRRELREEDMGIEIPDCGLRGITREERAEVENMRRRYRDDLERRNIQNHAIGNNVDDYERAQAAMRLEDCRRAEAASRRPADQQVQDRILQELEAMRGMINAQKGKGRGQLDEALAEAEKTPFTQEIQMQAIPPKCSLPTLSSVFDGSTCAIQHVKAYLRCMLQWEHQDAVLCKYFASSLTDEALKWFEGLPSDSIGSFQQLRSTFLGAYITNNESRLGIEHVFGLRQRPGEGLRGLTKRWKTMCSEVAGRVPERYLILSFITAMFPTNLLYVKIFRVKNSISMTTLRELQEEYITLEEKQNDMESYPVAGSNSQASGGNLMPQVVHEIANVSQKHTIEKAINQPQQKIVAMGSWDQEELERERIQYNRGANNKVQRFDQSQQQENYGGQRQTSNRNPRRVFEEIKLPPLNTTLEKIWEAIVVSEDLPPPPNMGMEPESGYGSRKFCIYHQFHGHNTSECSNLRRIVLKMINQGKLNQFLKTPQQVQAPPQQLPGPPPNQNATNEEPKENFYIQVGGRARNIA